MRFKHGRVLVLLLLLALPNIYGESIKSKVFKWGKEKARQMYQAGKGKAKKYAGGFSWGPDPTPPPTPPTTTPIPYKGGYTDWYGATKKVWLMCPRARSKEQYFHYCTDFNCMVGCLGDRSKTVSSTFFFLFFF